jgi:hypothetical protein
MKFFANIRQRTAQGIFFGGLSRKLKIGPTGRLAAAESSMKTDY